MPETIKRFFRRGGVIPFVTAIMTLGILMYLGITGLGRVAQRPRAMARLRHDPVPPTPQDLAVTLTRLGLDAQSLAAAGLTSAEATALVQRASSDLQARMQDIRDADADWGAKRGQLDQLEQLARAGIASEQDLSDLAAARTSLAASASTRQATLTAALAAAVNGLDSGKANSLAALRTNAAQWDLPTQYLAGSHAEADWVNLRDALANDRISRAQNVDPDPAAHQLILSALADPNVAAANSNLANNAAGITSAWNTAVFGH